MKVMCSLLLLAPCLSALMISCCKYFLINVKLKALAAFREKAKELNASRQQTKNKNPVR